MIGISDVCAVVSIIHVHAICCLHECVVQFYGFDKASNHTVLLYAILSIWQMTMDKLPHTACDGTCVGGEFFTGQTCHVLGIV